MICSVDCVSSAVQRWRAARTQGDLLVMGFATDFSSRVTVFSALSFSFSTVRSSIRRSSRSRFD